MDCRHIRGQLLHQIPRYMHRCTVHQQEKVIMCGGVWSTCTLAGKGQAGSCLAVYPPTMTCAK
eukprot:139045-Amphidinium_carterae.2